MCDGAQNGIVLQVESFDYSLLDVVIKVFEILQYIQYLLAEVEMSLGYLSLRQVLLLLDEVVDLEAYHLKLVYGRVLYGLLLEISKEWLGYTKAV